MVHLVPGCLLAILKTSANGVTENTEIMLFPENVIRVNPLPKVSDSAVVA